MSEKKADRSDRERIADLETAAEDLRHMVLSRHAGRGITCVSMIDTPDGHRFVPEHIGARLTAQGAVTVTWTDQYGDYTNSQETQETPATLTFPPHVVHIHTSPTSPEDDPDDTLIGMACTQGGPHPSTKAWCLDDGRTRIFTGEAATFSFVQPGLYFVHCQEHFREGEIMTVRILTHELSVYWEY